MTGVSLATICSAGAAEAQANRVTQITEIFRDVSVQPPSVVDDLGDIRPLADKSLLHRLRFTTSLYGEGVSNAKATGDNSSPDFLFIPTAAVSLDQPLGHGFSLEMVARSEAFIYATYDELSFWGFSGSFTAKYQPTKDWPRFYAGIEPYWYSSIHDNGALSQTVNGSNISDAVAISAGIDKDWAFNRDQTVAFIGYNFSNFFASPYTDNRNTERVTVGLTHQLKPSLFAQIFYSFQYSHYTDIDRNDYRNFVGLNFIYQIDRHWTAKATTYFVDNNSTQETSSYQSFGGGLSLSFSF